MKTHRRLYLASLSLGWLILSGSLSRAVSPGAESGIEAPDHGQKMESRMKEVERQLGLSAKQQTKIEAHRKAKMEESKKIRQTMIQNKDALRAELEKSDLDMNKVQALHQVLKEARNKLADHRLNGILEVRKILTPEQFKKFQELTHRKGQRQHHQHDEDHDGPPHSEDGE